MVEEAEPRRGEIWWAVADKRRPVVVVQAVPSRYHLVYRFGVPRRRTVVAAGNVVVEEGRVLART